MNPSPSPCSFVWRGSEEHFMKSHNLFRLKSGEVAHVIDALRRYLPSALENISMNTNHGIVNILSIGSGDGDMDIEILKIIHNEIKRQFPALKSVKMFNRAIEPQENHLKLYKTKIEKLPKELNEAQITFDIVEPQTFEEYSAKAKRNSDSMSFEVVHFIHSAYFFTDVEGTLKHCYDHELADKGIIALVLIGKDDTVEIVKHLLSNINHVGSEVASVASRNNWRYEVHTREYTIDVTEVFDEHSTEGNLLLDFFSLTMNFRAKSKPETITAVLETIKNNSTFYDGKILAKRYEDTHFIFK